MVLLKNNLYQIMNRRYKFITRKDKLKDKIFRNPTPNDITFAEVNRFLSQYQFVELSVRGSHYTFYQSLHNISITIVRPHGKDKSVKPPYIDKIKEVIEEIEIKKENF